VAKMFSACWWLGHHVECRDEEIDVCKRCHAYVSPFSDDPPWSDFDCNGLIASVWFAVVNRLPRIKFNMSTTCRGCGYTVGWHRGDRFCSKTCQDDFEAPF